MKNQENFDFDKYLSYKKSNADTTENAEKITEKEDNKKKPFKFPTFKLPVKSKNEENKEAEKSDNSVQIEENTTDSTNSNTEKEVISEAVIKTPNAEMEEPENQEIEEATVENTTLSVDDKVDSEENVSNHSEDAFTVNEKSVGQNEELPPEQEEKDPEKAQSSENKVQKEEIIENNTNSKESVGENKPNANQNTSSKKKKRNRKNKKRNKSNQPSAEVKMEEKPIEEVLDIVKDEPKVEKIEEISEASTDEKKEVTIITDAFEDKKVENPEENKHGLEKKNIIKDAFDKALDEDIEELNSVKVHDDAAVHYIPRKTKKPFFVIGIIILIMTVIGLVSTVMFLYNIIWDFANNTKQKEELANYLYPVVMTDPAMFDNPMQLTSEAICKAAIWDIILHEDISKYPHEYGNITIPEQDVEHHATKLFGTGLKFDHKNLGDVSLMFYYNPDKKSYTVPESPKFFSYSPNVEEIQKTAQDELRLQVAYISPSPAWLIQDPDDNSNVGKHMVYILGITDNGYVIKEIKEPEYKEPLM